LVDVKIRGQVFDEKTSASTGTLEVGEAKCFLPNKFATSSELHASKTVGLKKPIANGIFVSSRLVFPDSLKKLLGDENYLKGFARGISREKSSLGDVRAILFLVFRGETTVGRAEDLKTILDLQYFSDFDVITVQQTYGVSAEEFASLFSFAERWLESWAIDKPLMPVLGASLPREELEACVKALLKRGIQCLGVDMRGGFYYHTLRLVEEIKGVNPSLWVHVFQVPPKIRFGSMLPCSQGMVLPFFGVDSFSKWVVPPPPEPLTKDKINVFDRVGWGVFKRREFAEARGESLRCSCPICGGKNLKGFFDGKVFSVLGNSKVHEHYAQQGELKKSGDHIKDRTS